MRIEIAVDVETTLGDGPLWDVEQQRLHFIDSFDGRVFRCTSNGREMRAWEVPAKIRSIAIRTDGNGAICSLATSSHALDFETGACTLIHDPETAKPDNRIDDGKVDKAKRLVSGSMDTLEEGPNGERYRLDPDMTVTKLEEGIIVSNGPCWSPDGRTFCFTDSWSGGISAYDDERATGSIGNKRTFARMTEAGGGFDGATVDDARLRLGIAVDG